MTGYADGVRVEHAVVHHLTAEGYDCTRAAGSKGTADVIAIKPGQVLLVNCKRSRMPGPAERARLMHVSACAPSVFVPLVALKPPRQPLAYRLLTGYGPADWAPWTPDEIGGAS